MGEKSGINWTDYSFNAWWGCTKVSPACGFRGKANGIPG